MLWYVESAPKVESTLKVESALRVTITTKYIFISILPYYRLWAYASRRTLPKCISFADFQNNQEQHT